MGMGKQTIARVVGDERAFAKEMKVVIVGGGIIGASVAYYTSLHMPDADITVVERHVVAGCASGKAGGFWQRTGVSVVFILVIV